MELQNGTVYIDCFAGIAGDMALGALFDLGVREGVVRGELAKLGVEGWRLEVKRVKRGVMVGTKAGVIVEDGHVHGSDHDHDQDHGHDHAHAHAHAHVHYGQIREMIGKAGLVKEVEALALSIFDRIARVEAEIHGVPVAEVGFHEVGAVDSIIDIVGTAAGMAWLAPRRVVCRPVPLGGGMVRTAHGMLPVPAPATLALLRGMPVEPGGNGAAQFELTTPTGAAIVAATVRHFGPLPAMKVVATGWGAGDRELPDRPNLLRLVVGREAGGVSEGAGEECVVIEANVDDMNPQLCEPLLEALLQAGARDVWFTSVQMKKNRPGLMVSVLCDPPQREALSAILLRESTTLGVRWHGVQRAVLERRQVEVMTPFGPVLVKIGVRGGEIWNAAPEYESVRQRARERGVPFKQVYAAAMAAWLAK